MTGYVSEEYVDGLEPLTDDDTIGVVSFVDGDVVEGGARFDLRRLRAAILSAESQLGVSKEAHVSIVDGENFPVLVIRGDEHAARAVALAGRTLEEDPTEANAGP